LKDKMMYLKIKMTSVFWHDFAEGWEGVGRSHPICPAGLCFDSATWRDAAIGAHSPGSEYDRAAEEANP
jgi:hypothetical protein